MRDSKSLLLISISLLLFVISFVILCSWGYNFYYKIKDDKQASTPANHAVAPAVTKDSLQKIYTAAVSNLDTMLQSTLKDADSVTGGLNSRLDEFTRLRNEIVALLKEPASPAGIEMTRKKIGELQQRITALRNRNVDVEEENKKLYAVLQQLTERPAAETEIKTIPVRLESKAAQLPPKQSAAFSASDLQLAAVSGENNEDMETTFAAETEKLVGYFTVKNNFVSSKNLEMTIVITQPDGQVLRSAWESGVFSTPRGNKPYSCKVHFEYNSGESKRVSFSVSAEKYQKGNYTMQVYHNGIAIGRALKSLS